MYDLIPFLVKSIVVSGILTIYYTLALKNKRLHNYNRFFLLFTLYASIQLPLLNLEWSPVYEQPPVIFSGAKLLLHTINDTVGTPQAMLHTQDVTIDWQDIAMLIAVLISLAMLTTMLMRITWILRIGKRYPQSIVDGVTLVHTDLPKAPFSFLNRVYWRDSIASDTDNGRMILLHELAHIRQKHTYDKLACQLLTCIFWMNPFYWIIQKELGMVHEFIADEQAIVNNNDGVQEGEYTEAFARMLLQVHNRTDYFTPEHQFFSSPIKRRLTMLQTNKKTRASVLRRVAVLPLIAGSIFIFAFSPRKAPKTATIKAGKKIVLVVDAGHGGDDEGCRSGYRVEKDLNLKIANRIKELAPGYNVEVHLTRSIDKTLTLEERVAMSDKLHPDGFISIHVDDQPGKERGKGTFSIAVNDKNVHAEESKRLAYAVYTHVALPEWEQSHALSEKSLYVLKKNASPAMLIEIGDIKNKTQMQHLEDDTKLDDLCGGILAGVVEAHMK